MKEIRISKKTKYKIYIDRMPPRTWGQCDSSKKEITLKSGLNNDNLTTTLIHEIIHAIDFENHIGLSEAQTLKLEAGIYRFLKTNKVKLPIIK